MTTKTLLSLATVSLLAFAAKVHAYTVETTNSWFSVKASEDLDTSKWSGATPTKEEDAEVIDVDTGANNPAFYTPSETRPTSSTRYRVKGNMTVTLNAGVPAAFTVAPLPKAALVAASVDDDVKWYGWNGSDWVALTDIDAPVEGTSYDVAIEFFVESSQLKIKYIVGNESQTVTTSESALPALEKVGLAGYGSFGDFGALGFETFEVTITATGDTLSALKTAMGITGEINAAALNEKGANGLTKWESIVLGLPNASTVPYTAPVQTASGDTLGFTIGNANVEAAYATGTAVKVDVYEYNPATGECAATPVEGETQGTSSNGYTATVTPVSSGVKYYKIKITFQ